MRVWIRPGSQECSSPVFGSIALAAPNWAWSCITVRIFRNGKGAVIDVNPVNHKDREVLSLMQAVLSAGLARFVQDEGLKIEICVQRSTHGHGPIVSRAVLRAQVAPLLECATRYTLDDRMLGTSRIFKACMLIGRAW
jgi:hypothetical protein